MAKIVGKPTQGFVPIQEVRDGYAILKDNSLRAVLICTSVNFALKSEDEQKAILFQFQNMLNSLDFSIQIFVESRKLDIRPYIALLEQREKDQLDDLMKLQVQEYMGFIKNFTESTNIMTKQFFIVIPYSQGALKSGGMLGFLPSNKNSGKSAAKKDSDLFEEQKGQLEERITVVEQGLVRCGVRVAQLGTEEITELFYKLFNPGETEKPMKLT